MDAFSFPPAVCSGLFAAFLTFQNPLWPGFRFLVLQPTFSLFLIIHFPPLLFFSSPAVRPTSHSFTALLLMETFFGKACAVPEVRFQPVVCGGRHSQANLKHLTAVLWPSPWHPERERCLKGGSEEPEMFCNVIWRSITSSFQWRHRAEVARWALSVICLKSDGVMSTYQGTKIRGSLPQK